jgi:tRNA 2-thiouridine synthesizing protein D
MERALALRKGAMGKDKHATLTFAIMTPPFESAQGATIFRLLAEAIHKGFSVNVFAYEGAVYLPFARQQGHANAVHGRDLSEENHPLPKDWIEALHQEAQARGLKFDWVYCGLCVDERGAAESIGCVRRGSPADFWRMATDSQNTLTIGAH